MKSSREQKAGTPRDTFEGSSTEICIVVLPIKVSLSSHEHVLELSVVMLKFD